ncbi:hypothetical protein DSO57_1032634 [Entomophthora muscae]|uniref:Uncharacterized protein n=1 Tax=Entomophthora muscae TaxID=34485 RepID=A0ACC2T0D9_9FUNG|nr:hypothetical protein DSO57_1032634 [Entomophthora muscae]
MRKFNKLEDEEKEDEEDVNGGLGLHKEESSSLQKKKNPSWMKRSKEQPVSFCSARGETSMGSDVPMLNRTQ